MAAGGSPPAYIYLLQGSSVPSSKSPQNDAMMLRKFHMKIEDVLRNSHIIKAQVLEIIAAPEDLLSNMFRVKHSTLAIVKLQSTKDEDCLREVKSIYIPAKPENLYLNQVFCIGAAREKHCCTIKVEKQIFEENYSYFQSLCAILGSSYESDNTHNYIISGNLECIVIIEGSIKELGSLKPDRIKYQFDDSIKVNNILTWELLEKKVIGCTDAKPFKLQSFDSIARFILAFSQLETDEVSRSSMGWKANLITNENIINVHLLFEGKKNSAAVKIWEKLLQKYKETKRYGVVTLDQSLEFKHRRNLTLFLKRFQCRPLGVIEFGECKHVYLIYHKRDTEDVQSFIEDYKKENNLYEEDEIKMKKNDEIKMKKNDEESTFNNYIGVFQKDDADLFYSENQSIIDGYALKYKANVEVYELGDIHTDHTILSVEAENENQVILVLNEIEHLYSRYQQYVKVSPHPDNPYSKHVPSNTRRNSFSESLVNQVDNQFTVEQTETRENDYENTKLPKFKARTNKAPVPARRNSSASFVYKLTNTSINVKLQSITEMEVDAIVNAANEDLANIGGVSRVIASAAGPEFDLECKQSVQNEGKVMTGTCRVTGAGQLSPTIKKVIHAVSPVFDSYSVEEGKDFLYTTYWNVLVAAYRLKCKQVAITALGTGILGIPEDTSANCAVQAIADFLQDIHKKQKPSPEAIYLVDIDPDIITAFKIEIEKRSNLFKKL